MGATPAEEPTGLAEGAGRMGGGGRLEQVARRGTGCCARAGNVGEQEQLGQALVEFTCCPISGRRRSRAEPIQSSMQCTLAASLEFQLLSAKQGKVHVLFVRNPNTGREREPVTEESKRQDKSL